MHVAEQAPYARVAIHRRADKLRYWALAGLYAFHEISREVRAIAHKLNATTIDSLVNAVGKRRSSLQLPSFRCEARGATTLAKGRPDVGSVAET